MRVVGARPGEKDHEILVSEEECRHTYARNGYLVIVADAAGAGAGGDALARSPSPASTARPAR